MKLISSPLRYPGGKSALADFFKQVFNINCIREPIYVEPFAGGAGAGLALLFSERVSQIIINDADYHIYYFWKAVTRNSSKFIELIENTPLTVDEWHNQRTIYHNEKKSKLKIGFATFYLNRCNRSGIIPNGGPIGGHVQKGKYRIDARFNRSDLAKRIQRLACYNDRIKVSNLDGLSLLHQLDMNTASKKRIFVYLDPPYFQKGSMLYYDFYNESQHYELAQYLAIERAYDWILTYDNVKPIVTMYSEFPQISLTLNYSAHKKRVGKELLIHNGRLILPRIRTTAVAIN
jgi:DNA adenine methylase